MSSRVDADAASTQRRNVHYGQRGQHLFGTDAAALVERDVFGAVIGSNGYTTLDQADELAEALRLGPGIRLLDMGSGVGWPGLYLAAKTGCEAVLTDVPAVGVRKAATRAAEEGLDGRCAFAVASGVHLPFSPRTFDAVVHTDVLC